MIRSWNRILTVSLIILLCSVLSSSAFGQEDFATLVKSVHFTGGLGYANIAYPQELEEVLDVSETHIGGVGFEVAVYVSLPGSNNVAVGIDGSGALDNYTYTGLLGESMSMTVNHALFSLSSVYFFKEIGSGPFVRADLGLSRLEINVSDIFLEVEETSDYGPGLLLGGGIAFPVPAKGSIVLNANYSFRRVEGDNYKVLGLSIGYMY